MINKGRVTKRLETNKERKYIKLKEDLLGTIFWSRCKRFYCFSDTIIQLLFTLFFLWLMNLIQIYF